MDFSNSEPWPEYHWKFKVFFAFFLSQIPSRDLSIFENSQLFCIFDGDDGDVDDDDDDDDVDDDDADADADADADDDADVLTTCWLLVELLV